jgi:hypothetical protein
MLVSRRTSVRAGFALHLIVQLRRWALLHKRGKRIDSHLISSIRFAPEWLHAIANGYSRSPQRPTNAGRGGIAS